MSNISDRHSVVPFVAGKTAALTGQRLAKVGYKTTSKTKAKFPSIAVSVPVIPLESIIESAESLAPYVRTMLESAQDGIIRGLYESNNGNLSSVADSELSVHACIAWLENEATGGRLTNAAIQEWFDAEAAETVAVLIGEKLGFNDPSEAQMAQIQKNVAGYRGVFSSLAGGKTVLQPAQIRSCRNVLGFLEGEMVQRLNKVLDRMEEPVKVVELLDL